MGKAAKEGMAWHQDMHTKNMSQTLQAASVRVCVDTAQAMQHWIGTGLNSAEISDLYELEEVPTSSFTYNTVPQDMNRGFLGILRINCACRRGIILSPTPLHKTNQRSDGNLTSCWLGLYRRPMGYNNDQIYCSDSGSGVEDH